MIERKKQALLYLLFILSILGLIATCTMKDEEESNSKSISSEISSCTARGINYYKEMGSYPNLSDGRYADSVAKEKCERSLSAF